MIQTLSASLQAPVAGPEQQVAALLCRTRDCNVFKPLVRIHAAPPLFVLSHTRWLNALGCLDFLSVPSGVL
jgi:hypothetical protein